MTKVLKEYRMKPEPVPSGQIAVDPYALGLRSKLGGKPEWDQTDETPMCPHCGEEMTFVAQIDSIEHDSKDNPNRIDCCSDNQEYMFGDVGLIYVFFCFKCCETQSIFQCG